MQSSFHLTGGIAKVTPLGGDRHQLTVSVVCPTPPTRTLIESNVVASWPSERASALIHGLIYRSVRRSLRGAFQGPLADPLNHVVSTLPGEQFSGSEAIAPESVPAAQGASDHRLLKLPGEIRFDHDSGLSDEHTELHALADSEYCAAFGRIRLHTKDAFQASIPDVQVFFRVSDTRRLVDGFTRVEEFVHALIWPVAEDAVRVAGARLATSDLDGRWYEVEDRVTAAVRKAAAPYADVEELFLGLPTLPPLARR